MELSIVIVSFNTKELLEKCLKSLEKEIKKIKAEIIVVDNGSVDGSVEMAKKHQVVLVANKTNLGFAKAVNQGFKLAQGERVLLLNSDTQLTKDSLIPLLDFEKKVGPAIIGPRLLNPDGSVQPSVFFLPTIKRAFLEYWLGKRGYFSKYIPKETRPQQVEAILGGAMMISKEVINKTGFFDERYFMYFEDLDFCKRARKAGFKVYYFPESKIIHEHGASGKKIADEANQWRRLIPSSKIYYGKIRYFMIYLIMLTGQKICKKSF